jgi:hypothetical protein
MAEDAARELPNLPLEDALRPFISTPSADSRSSSGRRCAGSTDTSDERELQLKHVA